MYLLVLLGMIGPWQIVIIVVAIALLFYGGKKIPELMRGLGQGMKEFKKASNEQESASDKNESSSDKSESSSDKDSQK